MKLREDSDARGARGAILKEGGGKIGKWGHREVVFEPISQNRHGLYGWKAMFEELLRWRELTWRLFVRDLSTRYRQSVLSYVWSVLPAIGTVFVFVFLRSQKILMVPETPIPYPAYVLFGLLIWELFTLGLTAATSSLVAHGSLLAKINFPRECLVISSLGTVFFDFLLKAVLVGAVFVYFGVVPCWTTVLLPLVLVPVILLVLGLGFLLSLINAIVRDIGNLLSMTLGIVFFFVPIIYPPPVQWPFVLINDFNPIAALIIAAYDMVVLGGLSRPIGFVFGSFFSVAIFLIGWRLFHLAEPLLAERI